MTSEKIAGIFIIILILFTSCALIVRACQPEPTYAEQYERAITMATNNVPGFRLAKEGDQIIVFFAEEHGYILQIYYPDRVVTFK